MNGREIPRDMTSVTSDYRLSKMEEKIENMVSKLSYKIIIQYNRFIGKGILQEINIT